MKSRKGHISARRVNSGAVNRRFFFEDFFSVLAQKSVSVGARRYLINRLELYVSRQRHALGVALKAQKGENVAGVGFVSYLGRFKRVSVYAFARFKHRASVVVEKGISENPVALFILRHKGHFRFRRNHSVIVARPTDKFVFISVVGFVGGVRQNERTVFVAKSVVDESDSVAVETAVVNVLEPLRGQLGGASRATEHDFETGVLQRGAAARIKAEIFRAVGQHVVRAEKSLSVADKFKYSYSVVAVVARAVVGVNKLAAVRARLGCRLHVHDSYSAVFKGVLVVSRRSDIFANKIFGQIAVLERVVVDDKAASARLVHGRQRKILRFGGRGVEYAHLRVGEPAENQLGKSGQVACHVVHKLVSRVAFETFAVVRAACVAVVGQSQRVSQEVANRLIETAAAFVRIRGLRKID